MALRMWCRGVSCSDFAALSCHQRVRALETASCAWRRDDSWFMEGCIKGSAGLIEGFLETCVGAFKGRVCSGVCGRVDRKGFVEGSARIGQ